MRTSIAGVLLLIATCACGQNVPRWQHIDSSDGAFSFEMPGQPRLSTKQLTDRNGHPFQLSSYELEDGKSTYMVAFSDYDRASEPALDSFLRAAKAPRIIDRRKMTLLGHPAEVVEFETEQFRVMVRAIAVGKRLYQIAYIAVGDAFVRANAEHFLDSLRLR
jgi:hypothetical protein